MSVVTAVIHLLPMLLEKVCAISPPRTMRKWTVNEIRDVSQFVSIPLLPTGERLPTNGALPTISGHRGSTEWYNDAVNKGGRRGEVRLGLGVDRTPSAGPLFDRLVRRREVYTGKVIFGCEGEGVAVHRIIVVHSGKRASRKENLRENNGVC